MQTLGFDTYVEPLKLYLQKYREVNKSELCCEKELTNAFTINISFVMNLLTLFFDL